MEGDCINEFEGLRKRNMLDEDEEIEKMILGMCYQKNKKIMNPREESKKEINGQGEKGLTMWEVLEEAGKPTSKDRMSKSKHNPRSKSLKRGPSGNTSTGSSTESKTEDSDLSSAVTTSHSFKSRGFSQKWKERDTRLFFKALSLFGTDFSMVSLLFRSRDRAQLINKYHKEEKDNPLKVEQALKVHRTGNSGVLKRCGRLFDPPAPAEETNLVNGGVQRRRGASGSSLDSLDQMIFEEIDCQMRSSLAQGGPPPCPQHPPGSLGKP